MKLVFGLAILMTLNIANAKPTIQNAVDSFTSILKIGFYEGVNDLGEECSVNVAEANFPDKAILVTVQNQITKVSKLIEENSEFRIRAARKEFIQTEKSPIDNSGDNYVAKIIRTVLAGDNKLYVVTSNETVLGRESNREVAECVVNFR